MQRIAEFKEIQRRKWQIANKPHKTEEDLITLKCLSSIEESTVLLCDIYEALREHATYTGNQMNNEEVLETEKQQQQQTKF
jgi:hypothetical protein